MQRVFRQKPVNINQEELNYLLSLICSGRTRYLPQQSGVVKSASTTSRPPQSVSQSQPGSRSTSPNSLRLSYLSSSRTPTSTRSRIPVGSNGGSRISSRESSPGRTRTYFF